MFCFTEKRYYNLRYKFLLKIHLAESKTYGTNTLFFKASILWNTLLNKYKLANSISSFKNLIKSWNGESCNCSIRF